MFSEILASVAWCLILGKFSAFCSFFFLSSSWYPHYVCVTVGDLSSCPTVLRQSLLVSGCCCLPLFFLIFSFGNFYWNILKLRDALLSCISQLINPSKAFFTSVIVYFIYNISFWFFLGISSLCLPCPSILACVIRAIRY